MYNRYIGNTGRVERVKESEGRPPDGDLAPPPAAPGRDPPPAPLPGTRRPTGERRPPNPLSGLSGELGGILRRLSGRELETEDLLLFLLLYLLYRESGDEEFLLAIGGLLLF